MTTMTTIKALSIKPRKEKRNVSKYSKIDVKAHTPIRLTLVYGVCYGIFYPKRKLDAHYKFIHLGEMCVTLNQNWPVQCDSFLYTLCGIYAYRMCVCLYVKVYERIDCHTWNDVKSAAEFRKFELPL